MVVRREDLELHFFGMADFDPADSYGSCIVQVPDAGFSVVDPGGNWIRIFPAGGSSPAPSGKLAKVLDSAVVLGDSKDDPRQAAKILDSALSRSADVTVDERVEALAYRMELAVRLGEEERATSLLAELRGLPLTDADRARLASPLAAAEELG